MQLVSYYNCPYILELEEIFEDQKYYYIATKFLPGGDLYYYLSKMPKLQLEEAHARVIIRQIAIGIQALHRINIVHRDIKPDNILVSNTGISPQVCLADLGSAFRLKVKQRSSYFQIGTPGYMAPELLSGNRYSFSIDIWSFGCLIMMLLASTLPFWTEDGEELKRRVIEEPLNPDSDQQMRHLSNEVKNLLSGMLRKNPRERLTID